MMQIFQVNYIKLIFFIWVFLHNSFPQPLITPISMNIYIRGTTDIIFIKIRGYKTYFTITYLFLN